MARAVRREDCLGTAAAVDAKLLQVGSLQYMRWLPLKGPGGRQCQLATAAEVKLMDVPAYLGVGPIWMWIVSPMMSMAWCE